MSEYLLKFLHFAFPQMIGGFYLFIYFNFVLWVIATFPGLFTLKEKRTSHHGIFSYSSFFTLQINKPETSLIIMENAM